MTKHVTLSALKADMDTLFDSVASDRDELVVTRPAGAPLVVMTLSEWESMQETLHLLSDPANSQALRKAVADADEGRLEEHELIRP